MESNSIYLSLAGIGFFLIFLGQLRNAVSKIDPKFSRRYLNHLSSSKFKAIVLGIIAGFITTNAKALAVTAGELAQSGKLKAQYMYCIVAGGGIGSSMLVFYSTISIDDGLNILIFIFGLVSLNNSAIKKYATVFEVSVSILCVLLSLSLIKAGIAPIGEKTWFSALTTLLNHAQWVPVLIGFVLAAITQTGVAVVLVFLSFFSSGHIGEEQIILIAYGTGAGIGVTTIFYAFTAEGLPRKITLFSGINELYPIFILWPWLYLEVHGVSGVMALLSGIENPTTKVACIYMLYICIPLITMNTFCLNLIDRFLSMFSPNTNEDQLFNKLSETTANSMNPIELAVEELNTVNGLLHQQFYTRETRKIVKYDNRMHIFNLVKNNLKAIDNFLLIHEIDAEERFAGEDEMLHLADIKHVVESYFDINVSIAALPAYESNMYTPKIIRCLFALVSYSSSNKFYGIKRQIELTIEKTLLDIKNGTLSDSQATSVTNQIALLEKVYNRYKIVNRFNLKPGPSNPQAVEEKSNVLKLEISGS